MNHKQMVKPMLIGAAALLVLGVLGFPVGNYLPFLILLLCPLMMMFMMGGMNHGGRDDTRDDDAHSSHHREDT